MFLEVCKIYVFFYILIWISFQCARTTLTNKIISNNKDLTAIVLFGTVSILFITQNYFIELNKFSKRALLFEDIFLLMKVSNYILTCLD